MDYKRVCLVMLLLSAFYCIREVSGASTIVNSASLINGVRENENQEHIHRNNNPNSNVFCNKRSAKDNSMRNVSCLLVEVLVAAVAATIIVSADIINVFLIVIGVFLSAVFIMSLGIFVHCRTGGRRFYDVPKWIRRPSCERPQVQEMQERTDQYRRLEATPAGVPVRHRPYWTLQASAARASDRNRPYRTLEGRLEAVRSGGEEKGFNIYEEIGQSRSEAGRSLDMDQLDLPPPPPDWDLPHDCLEPI